MRYVEPELLEPVEHGDPTLGVVVSRNHLSWFVEEPQSCVLLDGSVDAALGRDLDEVSAGDWHVTIDHFVVHLHHATLDQFLCRPS